MKFFDAHDAAKQPVPELVQFFLARLGRRVTLEHQFAGHFFGGAKRSFKKIGDSSNSVANSMKLSLFISIITQGLCRIDSLILNLFLYQEKLSEKTHIYLSKLVLDYVTFLYANKVVVSPVNGISNTKFGESLWCWRENKTPIYPVMNDLLGDDIILK